MPKTPTADQTLIARVFRVATTRDAAIELLKRFRTTSAALVVSKKGLVRYSIYESVDGPISEVMFESVWVDLEAVRAAFGERWMEPHLPEGYETLIQSCSVAHYLVTMSNPNDPEIPTHQSPS